MIRRRPPIYVAYQGYEFTIRDWGDRTARFGSDGAKRTGDTVALVRDDGWLSWTQGGCLRKVCRAIDELHELDRVKARS